MVLFGARVDNDIVEVDNHTLSKQMLKNLINE